MNPGNNLNQNNQPQSQAPVVSPDAIMNALQGRPNPNQPNMGGQMNPNVPPMQQMNPNMPQQQQPMQPVMIPPQTSQTPPAGKKKIEPKTIFLVITMFAVILICTGIMILLGKEEEPVVPPPAPSPTSQEVSYTEKLNEISNIFNELDSVKAFKESKNVTVTSSVTGNTLIITITGDTETKYEANAARSILTLTSPTNTENVISPKEIFDCIVRAKGMLDGLELDKINTVLESEEVSILTLENNGVSYNDDGTTSTYSLNINSSISLPEAEATPTPSSNPNADNPNPTASPEPTASPNPEENPEPVATPSPAASPEPAQSPTPSPATNQ